MKLGAFPVILLSLCLIWEPAPASSEEVREVRFVDSPYPPDSRGETVLLVEDEPAAHAMAANKLDCWS